MATGTAFRELTAEQEQQFLDQGYVVVKQAVSRDLAKQWRDLAYRRLGYDPDDPATWIEARVHLPVMNRKRVADVAPRAWAAICDLLGGEQRIRNGADYSCGDSFIINFHHGADDPWQPPSARVAGWHKDGDFFRHFLDSPEQGLLTVVLWSDIEPRSGGTFVATDSVQPIARLLANHPEGLLPGEVGFGTLVDRCSRFVELTGRTGDVVLLHPYILHSASYNPSGRPRFITNPAVALNAPMDFNRDHPSDYSLVERAVLRALGVERIDFRPAAPRERVAPEREAIQARMLAQEKQRLRLS